MVLDLVVHTKSEVVTVVVERRVQALPTFTHHLATRMHNVGLIVGLSVLVCHKNCQTQLCTILLLESRYSQSQYVHYV